MSRLDLILPRLNRVRKAGTGYSACCPAHTDKTASLSLTETQDGRVLLHCFAGCSIHAITDALGISLSDLFPLRESAATPEERQRQRIAARQGQWTAALNVLAGETLVVRMAARMVASAPLSPEDLARLADAERRIDRCREVLCGN